jgi:hypothetical protein
MYKCRAEGSSREEIYWETDGGVENGGLKARVMPVQGASFPEWGEF